MTLHSSRTPGLEKYARKTGSGGILSSVVKPHSPDLRFKERAWWNVHIRRKGHNLYQMRNKISGAGSSESCILSLLTEMCQRNKTASKFSVVPALYVIQLQKQSHAGRNGLSLILM